MNAGLLTLVGSLAVGGPADPGTLPAPGGAAPGAVAGLPPVMPAMPQPGQGLPVPAPVLAARVLAPEGVRVTFYPGTPLARVAPAGALFGLRPGYRYRLELSNLPYQPKAALYPEVEVRGVLVPRAGMKYMEWPAPLAFSPSDNERAFAGAVITKVVYLEDPTKAIPSEFGLAAPVEVPAGTEEAAIKNALAGGRLVAIVRLGNKVPTPYELAATTIDGTVLLPGETSLRAPAIPPIIEHYACKLYDPLLGPKGPKEECLVDGGDKADPLGIGPNGRLGGLNPTDVGVQYTTTDKQGRPVQRVTTSNVVCVCVPRYVVQRAELAPAGYDVPVVLAAHAAAAGPQAVRDRQAAMAEVGREKPAGFAARVRPMAYLGSVGVGFFVGASGVRVVGQVEGVQVTGALVEPMALTAYPTVCPLTVTKSVGSDGPVGSGDEVTFTIRYVNTGVKPVSDLVVSDSLSGRLEYVAGSQQSDRAANFTASANEVGSEVVRWELPGVLLPGQGGVVKFRAKVR